MSEKIKLTKSRRGRPLKLTESTMHTLTEALRSGAYRADACAAAGISYQTFLNWEQKGEQAKSGEFFEFFNAVNKAEAEAMVLNVEIITTAARKGDWRAAAWFLEHRRPDQWSGIAKRRQDSLDEEIRLKAMHDEEAKINVRERADKMHERLVELCGGDVKLEEKVAGIMYELSCSDN